MVYTSYPQQLSEILKNGHGGKRAGAGKPKGVRWQSTLDKIAAREFVRQRVTAQLSALVDAQIANAQGISHLFLKDKTGRFVQITDPAQIETVLNSGERDKYFYIHTKDPSTQAFTDLLNRALDKPAEQVQEIKLSGELNIVERLQAARQRLAKLPKS